MLWKKYILKCIYILSKQYIIFYRSWLQSVNIHTHGHLASYNFSYMSHSISSYCVFLYQTDRLHCALSVSIFHFILFTWLLPCDLLFRAASSSFVRKLTCFLFLKIKSRILQTSLKSARTPAYLQEVHRRQNKYSYINLKNQCEENNSFSVWHCSWSNLFFNYNNHIVKRFARSSFTYV